MYNNDIRKLEMRSGDDLKAMEHTTLRVPYEILNKKYRVSQKNIDREVSHLNQSVNELKKSPTISIVNKALDDVVKGLNVVKRKAEESILDEIDAAQTCKRRLEHLKGYFAYDDKSIKAWDKKRLDRLLIDHLFRNGYYDSAKKLAEQSDLEDLTDIDLFLVSQKIEDSLANKDISKCLAWCHDNRSKLKKIKSTLELKLRQQEFIELIKQDRKLEAIIHSRKHLTSNIDDFEPEEFEQTMGLLAFPTKIKEEPYRSLLDDSRWLNLVEHFKQDNFNLHQMNPASVFSVVLQAGLSALKTQHCYPKSGQRDSQCPICSTLLNQLAKDVPYPHCSQSKLICALSGEPLNEHNPPLMLPNGYIYGEKSLKEMASRNNGRIKCQKTGFECHIDDVEKVFVM